MGVRVGLVREFAAGVASGHRLDDGHEHRPPGGLLPGVQRGPERGGCWVSRDMLAAVIVLAAVVVLVVLLL
jgi:hypothetical protein